MEGKLYKTSIFLEPGIKEYMIRIMNTIFVVLLWLLINITAGMKYGLAFINENEHISTGNIFFYCWLMISFATLVWWAYRLWSKPIDFDRED